MRLWPKSLKWQAVLLTLVGLLAVGVSGWFTFGQSIRYAIGNQVEIHSLRGDPHPVTRGLARDEIRAGMSVEELIATHTPDELFRSGQFVRAYYLSERGGTYVVAVDGRVARGAFCALGQHTVFFDHLTADENSVFWPILPENEPLRTNGQRTAHRAAAGVAGYCAACDWPPSREVADPTEE